MFQFLNDAFNYEDRKVARWEKEDATIDTCKVSDSKSPYETGIRCNRYNDNHWIIVEEYNTLEEAKEGHNKWIETMKNPPSQLQDVSTCDIKVFAETITDKKFNDVYERKNGN